LYLSPQAGRISKKVQSIISNIALMFTDCGHFNSEVIDLRAASEFFSGFQKHKRLYDGQSGVPPFLRRNRRERRAKIR